MYLRNVFDTIQLLQPILKYFPGLASNVFPRPMVRFAHHHQMDRRSTHAAGACG
jgi:hypothetical protein